VSGGDDRYHEAHHRLFRLNTTAATPVLTLGPWAISLGPCPRQELFETSVRPQRIEIRFDREKHGDRMSRVDGLLEPSECLVPDCRVQCERGPGHTARRNAPARRRDRSTATATATVRRGAPRFKVANRAQRHSVGVPPSGFARSACPPFPVGRFAPCIAPADGMRKSKGARICHGQP
jgi:hypothetical protein